ncbi:MAG: hypothetical protein JST93_03805 [Acidobacteria bacterium]|nr:hypothetical protein [Acidobacteriota bacterium]
MLSVATSWLVLFCLLLCGSMQGAEPEQACHRTGKSHCPKMGPAKCVVAASDVPKAPVVADGVLTGRVTVVELELGAERWGVMECRRAVDRNVLLRVLRI